MKRYFRIFLMAIAMVFICSLALAANFDAGTFTFLGNGDAETLDPAKAYDVASGGIIFQCYDNLVQYKPGSISEFEPLLASKVPSVANGLISKDGKTYTFPIRTGVKFHNGAVLTPQDVQYSFLRGMLADPNGGANWMLLEPLLGVSTIAEYACKLGKVDDFSKVGKEALLATAKAVMGSVEVQGNNVIFHLVKAYPPFLAILAKDSNWSAILNKKWMIEHGDWDGNPENWVKWHDLPTEKMTLFDQEMGTGPFIHVKWDRSTGTHTFTAFKDYFRGPAKLKTVIENNGVTEFNTKKLMLQQGAADAIWIPTENVSQMQSVPNVVILTKLPWVSNTVAIFNQGIKTEGNELVGSGKLDGKGIPADFFSDINVRKGFCYAFDYASYIKDVAKGQGSTPYGPIPIAFKSFFDTKMEKYNYNPKKAEEYFKKAFNGEVWKNGFKFTLVYNIPNNSRKTATEILKFGLESINPKFKVDVLGMEWPTLLPRRREGQLPLVFVGWQADYADPHNFAFAYLNSSGDYMKYCGTHGVQLAQKVFDPLVDAGIGTTDLKQRAKIYTEIQKKAFEYAPYLCYVDELNWRVMGSWVKGFVNDPIRPCFYDYYSLYKVKK